MIDSKRTWSLHACFSQDSELKEYIDTLIEKVIDSSIKVGEAPHEFGQANASSEAFVDMEKNIEKLKEALWGNIE